MTNASYNGFLAAKGYGSRVVRVQTINKGWSVIAAEDESADSRAFYPMARTASDITMMIICADAVERDSLADWIKGYGAWLVGSPSSLMEVSVPAINYRRYGIPAQGMNYNSDVQQIAASMTLTLTGVVDPDDPALAGLTSRSGTVTLPVAQAQVGAYFYPTGTQLTGTEGIDATIFDAQIDLAGMDLAANAAEVLGLPVPGSGGTNTGRAY